jgi:hypothetical protein
MTSFIAYQFDAPSKPGLIIRVSETVRVVFGSAKVGLIPHVGSESVTEGDTSAANGMCYARLSILIRGRTQHRYFLPIKRLACNPTRSDFSPT